MIRGFKKKPIADLADALRDLEPFGLADLYGMAARAPQIPRWTDRATPPFNAIGR